MKKSILLIAILVIFGGCVERYLTGVARTLSKGSTLELGDLVDEWSIKERGKVGIRGSGEIYLYRKADLSDENPIISIPAPIDIRLDPQEIMPKIGNIEPITQKIPGFIKARKIENGFPEWYETCFRGCKTLVFNSPVAIYKNDTMYADIKALGNLQGLETWVSFNRVIFSTTHLKINDGEKENEIHLKDEKGIVSGKEKTRRFESEKIIVRLGTQDPVLRFDMLKPVKLDGEIYPEPLLKRMWKKLKSRLETFLIDLVVVVFLWENIITHIP